MSLPVHPITGVQAIGFTRRGPVWPVMGGNGEGEPPNPGTPPEGQPPKETTDKGFPENTPIAEMTVEQQLAYFKHHDRRKAATLSQFEGITPEDAKAARDKVAELEREKLSADERALADAREQASLEARSTAEAEANSKWGSKLLEAVSGAYLDADQQKSFLAIADASKFMKDGEFDVDGLMGHLTAIYGVRQRQFGSGLPQHQNWGQNTGQPPGTSGADLGLAEAQKRFGTRN